MNAPIPLPDPRLAAIERRLGIVETRTNAIADIVARHPNDTEIAASPDAHRQFGEAVVAFRVALEALHETARRLIGFMPQ